tara:strand:- start:245 stop:1126 length:882 start_codon:yes stop_codon:yes gene_type:complete
MFTAGGISHSDRKFLGRLKAPFFDTSDFSNDYSTFIEGFLGSAFYGIQWHGSAMRLLSYVTNDRTAPDGDDTIDCMDWRTQFTNYDTGAANIDLFGFRQFTINTKSNVFIDSSNPIAGLTPYRTSDHDNTNEGNFDSIYNIYAGEKAFFFPCISDQIIMPVRINSAGSGYTNGNYTNLSTTATSGSGSGLKVNVRVSGGSVTKIAASLETPFSFTSSSTGHDSSYSFNDVGTVNGIPGGGSGAQYKIGSTSTNFGGNVRSYRMMIFLFMYQPASKAGGSLTNFGLNTLTTNYF